MKKFAILFAAAVCMVAFTSQDSFAQCRGGGVGVYGGGFYGGGAVYRPVYRPSVGISYNSYARPYYNAYRPNYYRNYNNFARPVYGGNFYRGGTCGRGVSIRF